MIPAILGIAGPVLLPEERALFAKYPPRGVILFGRNIIDPAQLAELVGALRAALPEGAVLMVDQEGGRVARLRPPHWPALPAAGTLADEAAAYAHGRALGAMVRQAGFDVAAAPVLDLRHPGASDVVGDRAISGDATRVAALGRRIADGITAEGVIPVMKHLPGHGWAKVDSHVLLPYVEKTDLEADLLPFRFNSDLLWGMTAHIVYAVYDSERPATLSRTVIDRIIRGKIGFKGVLVSDDLAMKALSGSPAALALAARAAGCDIALYCPGDLPGNTAILETLHAAD